MKNINRTNCASEIKNGNIHLNYDNISDSYDERYQDDQRKGTLEALEAILSDISPKRILEVGCGTGHWLKGLRSLQNTLCGLDASSGMLNKAKQILPGCVVKGVSRALPFANVCFGLVYCVNAIHHFQKKQLFILEAWRLLAPGGTLAIIGMDPRDPRNCWYIYDYFESTRKRDLDRFPAWDEVISWLTKSGFINIQKKVADVIHEPKTINTVLSDPFLKKEACSQLALLSREDYLEGINRIKDVIQNPQNRDHIFENDILLEMLTAQKPPV